MNTYTKEQVAEHKGAESCWIEKGNNVYDVTKFLEKHPGGANAILKFVEKGIDGATAFSHHPAKAQQIWESMLIGTLIE